MGTSQSSKTELFAQWLGGNLVISNQAETTGRRVWVHATTGTDAAGYGASPDAPVASLAYALTLCTANKGDVIYLMPGHAETITTAVALSVAGVRVIGLGTGLDRPKFTVGANNIDGLDVTGDGVVLDNLYFNEATVSAANANINIAAANVTVRNVHMDMGANDRDGFTITDAGEKPLIEHCSAIVTANGPDTWITFEGVIDMPVIRHNYIIASDGTDIFDDHILDFGGLVITNPIVVDNVFDGADQAVNAIDDAGSCVGDCFAGNRYAGSAVDGDTVTTTTAAIADGGITAAKIATDAIDADALAADALAEIEAEAEDALEGENLDHLAKTAVVNNADMTAEVVDGTVLANILSKTSDTSSYSPTTDSLEMLSDKAGGFSGDGGANQDDSIKASLDLAHTDLDAILADTGTDGVVIADGAITSAKFGANAIDSTVLADGAIDATAIAGDAITNAKIADDAIAAENIATGAITADAFAADAIVAATLATGAFTADAFAANAIVAGTLAGDCITNAKIADDAIAAENIATGALTSDAFAVSVGEYTCDGIVVTRATAALPQSTAGALFTVTGHVLLKRILGVVTTQIGNVANVAHLQLNSTGAGATTDLCLAAGGLDIDNDVADTMYEITGTVGDAMVATTNLPKNPSQLLDLVLPPGSLELECAASDGGGGRVRWSVTYVPLEAGANMVAA